MTPWEPVLRAPDPADLAPSSLPSQDLLQAGAHFQGRLTSSPKGFAFVSAPDGGPDLFIPPASRAGAQHGELVVVELARVRHDGRREGVVQDVLSSAPSWAGVVEDWDGVRVLAPQDARFPWVVLSDDVAVGHWAVVRLARRGPWQGENELRQALANGLELTTQVCVTEGSEPTYRARSVSRIRAALAGFQDHEETAHQAAAELSDRPLDQAAWQYTDLRHIPFMTIDGEVTKDFDDALWAERLDDGNYRLWVAIADVAAYVEKDSLLDQQARQRTTSVYLPGLVLPMLPHALSEGACSLNPGVDRAAMVLSLDIDSQGRHVQSQFQAALIHSHARLTYSGASNWLESAGNRGPSLVPGVTSGLSVLGELTNVLLDARKRRGALDFDRTEYRLAFTPEGEVRGVFKPTRTQAHRVVEECMVAANVAAARFLRKQGLPLLSRHHPAPSPQRLATLLAHYPEAQTGSSGALGQLIALRPELLPFVRLATGAAEYTPHGSGHFGLALDEYAHFTSPIRRYPDILVHRALHVALGNLPASALDEHWATLGMVSTERERAASTAERAATDLLRIEWLSRELLNDPHGPAVCHVATIDGATPAGVFLTLDSCGASGLLRPPSGSEYVPALKAWRHADGTQWLLGQQLEVCVTAIDVAAGRISFDQPLPSPSRIPGP